MSYTITKAVLDELPAVLLDRVNSQIKDGYRVLDINKTVTTSELTKNTYVDYQVKLNDHGVFIELNLSIYPQRENEAKDVSYSVISTNDILFYIKNNENLFSRVSDLVNAKNQG